MADSPPPARVPSPRPPSVPGAKRARHKRWTRITWVVTAAALVAFGVAAFVLLRACARAPSPAEQRVIATENTLEGLAAEIEHFRSVRHRLPQTFVELRDPALPSRFDPEPWDSWKRPIQYHVDADGTSFRLRSSGPDEAFDTPDDLVWPAGAPWR